MKLDSRDQRGEIVLTVQGTFAPRDVPDLRARLVVLADRHVTIDFHDARSVNDVAVAELATEVGDRVSVVGLTEHHRRLLRYLGLRSA